MIKSMCDVLSEAYRRGWISVRDGNVSVRIDDDFYITPSGVRKNDIQILSIIKATVIGEILQFETGYINKASGELRTHSLLQLTPCFTNQRSVVHLHPTHVVAVMEAGWDLQKIALHLPELSRYTKVGPNVSRLPVTSDILAKETFEAMTEISENQRKLTYDIVGQIGHGVTSIGESPWDCFDHIERLNHACEIMLLSGVKP